MGNVFEAKWVRGGIKKKCVKEGSAWTEEIRLGHRTVPAQVT